jgi:hypothetical protein
MLGAVDTPPYLKDYAARMGAAAVARWVPAMGAALGSIATEPGAN